MSDAPHRNVVRVIDAGTAIGLDVQPVRFPEGTKTAVDAAAAIGCGVGQIVKSLIFAVDGEVVLAYVSGSNQLDETKLALAAGGAVCSRVDADTVRAATGFPIGGVPAVRSRHRTARFHRPGSAAVRHRLGSGGDLARRVLVDAPGAGRRPAAASSSSWRGPEVFEALATSLGTRAACRPLGRDPGLLFPNGLDDVQHHLVRPAIGDSPPTLAASARCARCARSADERLTGHRSGGASTTSTYVEVDGHPDRARPRRCVGVDPDRARVRRTSRTSTATLDRLLGAGDVFVDVGANVGLPHVPGIGACRRRWSSRRRRGQPRERPTDRHIDRVELDRRTSSWCRSRWRAVVAT